jgi:hypothetical protein
MMNQTGFGKKHSFGILKVLALHWSGCNEGKYGNIRIANLTA